MSNPKWRHFIAISKEAGDALAAYRKGLSNQHELTFYQRQRLSLEKEKVEFLGIIADLIAHGGDE
jgi:hypothetical protein